jgi:hypothetical protein
MSRYRLTHLGDSVPILCKAFIVVVMKENMEKVIERFLEWEGGCCCLRGRWGLDKERSVNVRLVTSHVPTIWRSARFQLVGTVRHPNPRNGTWCVQNELVASLCHPNVT